VGLQRSTRSSWLNYDLNGGLIVSTTSCGTFRENETHSGECTFSGHLGGRTAIRAGVFSFRSSGTGRIVVREALRGTILFVCDERVPPLGALANFRSLTDLDYELFPTKDVCSYLSLIPV